MEKNHLYTSLMLLNGSKCDIIMPKGENFFRASKKYGDQSEFSITLFVVQELCRIDGQQMPIDFYKELGVDDIVKIAESMTEVLTIIR